MRLGEMFATISCRKPLAFRLTLLTAFWSVLVSDATSSIALCTLSQAVVEKNIQILYLSKNSNNTV